MTHHDLLRTLSEHFGQDKIIVRSQYHVQVRTGESIHNIWFNRNGNIKWQLAGQRNTEQGSGKRLIGKLIGHNLKASDLGKMQASIDLSRSIVHAGQFAAHEGIHRGVFVDAGFKDTRAKIAIIAILDEEVRAISRPIDAANSQDAERQAIEFAVSLYPEEIIYSDCEAAVNSVANKRVLWISRDWNRPADMISNLRGT